MQDFDDTSADLTLHAAISDRPRVDRAIAEAALAAALTPDARRQLERETFAWAVRVPSAAWLDATTVALRALVPHAAVTGTTGARHDRPYSDAQVVERLGAGRPVIGIAPSLLHLPPALVRTADARISLQVPFGRALEPIISTALGGCCPRVPEGLGAGLDLLDLAAAIRPGSTPAEAVARIAAAADAVAGGSDWQDAPPLATLHGYGAAMDWCLELVADVRDYRAGRLPWNQVRSSVLLASDPGCGKTSLMRSLARELRAPLVATSVSSWFTTFNAGALDDVLRAARESHSLAARQAAAAGVSLWFLDELDALPDRAALEGRGRDWWTPVVGEILTLVDGAIAAPGVIVIGATNHPARLDAALVRPGRLSRTIWIEPPAPEAIPGILRTHLGGDLSDADLGSLAGLGAGRTGAALAAAVVEARAIARRAGRPLAIEDLAAALAPPDRRSEAERYRTAVHEAGHAVAALALGHAVHSVSILAQGGAGGLTVTGGGAPLPTRADLEAHVVVGLAGRAAEEVVCGEVSAGASADLADATARLAEVHCSLGLGARLRVSSDPRAALTVDRELAAAVEADLVRLYACAVEIVRGARPGLDRLVDGLMARRVLSGAEVQDVLMVEHSPPHQDRPRAPL